MMNEKEAIKIINNIPNCFPWEIEALDMAIKALETASCIKEKCAYCPHCEHCDVDDETLAIKALDQQPCKNYISIDDAIDVIAGADETDGNEPVFSGKQVIEMLKNLPFVTPKASWIPVSERLPEKYCLFCDIDGDVYYGHIYDKKWWAEGQNDRIKNVTAWMPLPQPYNVESEKMK